MPGTPTHAPAGVARFGDVIRTARESRQISREQLAERSGINADNVGRIERGRVPLLSTAAALAAGLGTTLSALLDGIA